MKPGNRETSIARRRLLKVGIAATFYSPLTRGQLPSLERVATVVGTGVPGQPSDGTPASEAEIDTPFGVVIGPDRALYWCDFGSDRVLRLDLENRRLSVVAGNGTRGYSGDGGLAAQAQLGQPHEVRFDAEGDLYVVELLNHTVRRVDMRTRVITTVAGTGAAGYAGDGGPAAEAQLSQPHGIVFDAGDNLYICDIENHRVRRVDANTGIITTYAGNGETGPAVAPEGSLSGIALAGPRSMDVSPDGTMYLVLREGNTIFELDPERRLARRIAGTGEIGYSGDGGPAVAARFGSMDFPAKFAGPKGIAYSSIDHTLYIADTENHVIRRIDLTSGLISTVVGNGERGDGPDGDPAACRLNRPHGVFVDRGTLYIGDSDNHRIRVVSL